LDELTKEIAYIAYHFHWKKDDILDMTHQERHKWAEEISSINDRINSGD